MTGPTSGSSRDTHEAAATPTDLEIDTLSDVAVVGPYGDFASFDEIVVGKESPSQEWTITSDTIDAFCTMQDESHEWYSIDSPFGGRVAPLMASAMIIRALMPYRIAGLFAGWDARMHQALMPDVPYVWKARIADKWTRNDREWVAIDGTCHDPEGVLVHSTRRVHVLDFQRISERGTKEIAIPVPDEVFEVEEYAPLTIRPRVPDEWVRDLEKNPVSNAHYGRSDMPVGQDLVPVSRQYTWRKARDHAEIMYTRIFGWPTWMASHSFHVHPGGAASKGLERPNISGLDPTGTLMSNMMLALAGQGWLAGGEFAYRIIKQIGLDDFVTAKGTLTEKIVEGPNTRLVCAVWCENQRGEKVVTGEASAVVPT